MRKVILWVGTSLDGFTSDEQEQLDWLVPHATQPEAQEFFQRLREHADTILLGRVNYEGFFGYWPKVKDDPRASPADKAISRWLDDTQKVVFSRTLRAVTWKNARLAGRDAAAEVAALKRDDGGDIIIQNSTRLAQSLFAADLVDEIALVVAPVALGKGRALFAGLPHPMLLERTELVPMKDGTIVVQYRVKRGAGRST
jgi:dihydrofolate reductase